MSKSKLFFWTISTIQFLIVMSNYTYEFTKDGVIMSYGQWLPWTLVFLPTYFIVVLFIIYTLSIKYKRV